MESEPLTGHLAETLEQLARHWESRRSITAQDPSGGTSRAFSIALSRQAGTQGTLIARELSRRLGWPVYDHELLERISLEMGVRTNLLETVDERKIGWLEESFQQFLDVPQVNENAYARHLVKCVLALGLLGECIIVGRGAAFILPAETTLRVRLVAPKKDRLATLCRNLGLSGREATRRLSSLDRQRNDFVRSHFLTDPTDPANYDLLLNVARFSSADACESIADSLQRLQSASRTEMALHALTH
jgi:cytidylate kinase